MSSEALLNGSLPYELCHGWDLPWWLPAHSSVLAWRIPGTGEPGELQSMGSQRRGHFPGGSVVKTCPPSRRCGSNPWIGMIPWRRERLPSPVFLPGELHGQINLVGYSPWGRKESDTTKTFTLKGMATHSSFLAWRIPWTEEVGRL